VTLKKQKIGIFGLGKTGISVYEAMSSEAEIIVYDDVESSREMFAGLYGEKFLAPLFDVKWQNLDKIILSPGVSLEHEIVRLAKIYNIPIISDIDLLFEKSKGLNFIAVTGTNGKSTTTSLISYILSSNNHNYPAAGNIGVPVLQAQATPEGYVLELSSFQLDLVRIFTAKIAVLLNITPDHLDRYKNMEAYIAAKCKIFDRMSSGSYAIINVDDHHCREIFFKLKQNINLIPFSVTKILEKGISIISNRIYDSVFTNTNFALPFNKGLQGIHNYENIAAAYAAVSIFGLNSAQILESIKQFQGLPHRMQYIGSLKQINFYNDSKATNSCAASKSIQALDNIYWLAGGVPKAGGIEDLNSLFSHIKKAYLFGQAKEIFAKTLENKVNFEIYENLEEAFEGAFKDAYKDTAEIKNILFAPATASYDQFKNFEERGELFIKLSLERIEEK
jgi:UDP-N-acetylmuramoylalanine--D-glutamate ligase